MLLAQAHKIQMRPYKPDMIFAIARGGLIPARILVDLLETPQFALMQIEFYMDIAQTRQQPTIKQAPTVSVIGKNVLLVDDIADTGKSLQLAKTLLQQQSAFEIQTVTLYYNHQSIIKPDFYGKETNNWVIFPWETKETLRKIIQKHIGKRQFNQEIVKLVKAGFPKQLADKLLKDM